MFLLKKADLDGFLDGLATEYEVLAPVEEGGLVSFGPHVSGRALDHKARPRLSVKEFYHPQREEMFTYTTDPEAEQGNILQEVLPTDKRVIFGVSSCDARSVILNGMPFVEDPNNPNVDVYYKARWENTALIGWGCDEPCVACFCHATGGGPFGEEGLDIILTDLGDRLLVKPLTDKGQALAGLFAMDEAAEEDISAAEEKAKEAFAAMPKGLKLGQPSGQDLMGLFELPIWSEIADRCLNCGACTYLCPTCYCFDILDETREQEGVRFRIWDSCMFPLYSHHGSGHNPRPDKAARVRQRFMHKLKYFPDRHEGKVSCVGCGRCVVYCPVNIDIREVASQMKVGE